MKINIIVLCLLFQPFIFCGHLKNKLIIEGKITGIPSKKIYLVEAHEWSKFLDSTAYDGKTFLFTADDVQFSIPFMCSIAYIDSITKKINTLQFENHILSTKEQGYIMNAFILENGSTLLKGSANIREDFIKGTNTPIREDSIFVKAGKETDVLFRTQMMDFGFLDNNSSKRSAQYQSYIDIIKEYPSSLYLLQCLWQNKSLYTNSELAEVLSHFTANAQNSSPGVAIKRYTTNRPDKNKALENIVLLNDRGNQKHILQDTSSLNILIFWASWCGPCHAEIPDFKEIKNSFPGNKVHLASISIDENKTQWLSSVNQERMDWDQFIVDSAKIETVKQQFDFSAIPVVIITDKTGKELKRFTGYEKTNKQKIDSFLTEYLANNK